MAPTTFHPFSRLPSELREMIWQYASGGDGYNHNGLPRTIEVLLLPTNARWIHSKEADQCEPSPGLLRFNFRLIEGSRADRNLDNPRKAHPLSQTVYHSREVFLRLNPDRLRLVDLANPKRSCPIIRFNASRDTIFMDLESLYYLRQYTGYLNTNVLTFPRLLCGFDRIQNLSRPLGSATEVALDVLCLLDGGAQEWKHPVLPLVRRMCINETVPESVKDMRTLSLRLCRTLRDLWHWSLSREQRDHLKSELDRVLHLGGGSTL